MTTPPVRSQDSTKRRAIVFDLDGTLVDSAPDIQDAINTVLGEEKRTEVGLSRVIGMIGDGAEQLVARAFAESGARPEGAALLTCFPASSPAMKPIPPVSRSRFPVSSPRSTASGAKAIAWGSAPTSRTG